MRFSAWICSFCSVVLNFNSTRFQLLPSMILIQIDANKMLGLTLLELEFWFLHEEPEKIHENCDSLLQHKNICN